LPDNYWVTASSSPAGSASLSGPTRRRGEIPDAAAALFAREGYRGTSMREVATAAGIQAGSLYHHFPSKEAIAVATLLRGFPAEVAAHQLGGDPVEPDDPTVA
jgi:AcrR family transcriptional regulator